MRGAPHVGFSATIWKIRSSSSLLMRLRPQLILWRERQCQYLRNPARCQRTTVSGVTRTRQFFHSDQTLFMPTQKSLSTQISLGRCLRCLKIASCWRRARFSSRRSRREQRQRHNDSTTSPSRRNMVLIYSRSVGLVTGRKLLKSECARILARDRSNPHGVSAADLISPSECNRFTMG